MPMLSRFLMVPALLAVSVFAAPAAAQVACTLSCPSNVSTATAPGAQTATVNYPIPVPQGANCVGQPVQTAGLPSGAAFPIGTTVNAWRVDVTGGGFATCQFNVIVFGTPAAPVSVPTTSLAGLAVLLAGLLGFGLLMRRRSS